MMHQNEKFDCYENETFKAVQLLYGNGTYCMTVMLPNEGKSIDDMMKGMDTGKFMTMMGNVEECEVDLKLPKFTTEMELPLNDIISQLGALFTRLVTLYHVLALLDGTDSWSIGRWTADAEIC